MTIAQLRQAIEQSLYKWNASGGNYEAANPAQRLGIELRGDEVRLKHPNGSAAFRLALTAINPSISRGVP